MKKIITLITAMVAVSVSLLALAPSSTIANKVTPQGPNNSILPTSKEIKETNAQLPVFVADNTVFYKVEYDRAKKIQRFYYRFTVDVDAQIINNSFIKQRKEIMKKALEQRSGSMARINAGMTYSYLYYSNDNKLLYEIRINKGDF